MSKKLLYRDRFFTDNAGGVDYFNAEISEGDYSDSRRIAVGFGTIDNGFYLYDFLHPEDVPDVLIKIRKTCKRFSNLRTASGEECQQITEKGTNV